MILIDDVAWIVWNWSLSIYEVDSNWCLADCANILKVLTKWLFVRLNLLWLVCVKIEKKEN